MTRRRGCGADITEQVTCLVPCSWGLIAQIDIV